ncbi:NAD(P)H-binding protein [uncultured Secundilactobacillus sp.]|uniref:NAD(P)H-binding protein n=1 Tax=uncultured Secundilactobacillus sp. TaxID=2813935 RepID=UPI00258A0376|nr:NAD(P)H-binding protein [uncultured Secundilactobacillus sp.]
MTHVLLLGATGSLGTVVRQYFKDNTQDELTMMVRHPLMLQRVDANRETAVTGDALNHDDLARVMTDVDVVIACLSGRLPDMARNIVDAQISAGITRLIFVTAMGIYNEIPETVGLTGNLEINPMLIPYREAADIIEASPLNYTIIRPGWFDNQDDLNYQTTKKGAPVAGHDVSRKSVADLMVKLAHDSQLGHRESLGINRIGS